MSPYVEQSARERLRLSPIAETVEEVHHRIARCIVNFLHISTCLSYQTCNDVMAALDTVRHAIRSGEQPEHDRTARGYLIGDVYHIAKSAVGTYDMTDDDVCGVLVSAALEFYRRVVAPLADRAIARNSDCGYERFIA